MGLMAQQDFPFYVYVYNLHKNRIVLSLNQSFLCLLTLKI